MPLDTRVWTQIRPDTSHRRLSHAVTQVGSYLFITGGHDGNEYTSDLLMFNLGVYFLPLVQTFEALKPPLPHSLCPCLSLLHHFLSSIVRSSKKGLITDSRPYIFPIPTLHTTRPHPKQSPFNSNLGARSAVLPRRAATTSHSSPTVASSCSEDSTDTMCMTTCIYWSWRRLLICPRSRASGSRLRRFRRGADGRRRGKRGWGLRQKRGGLRL